jgi:fructose-specific component phosphotransferase system IIB-like protein
MMKSFKVIALTLLTTMGIYLVQAQTAEELQKKYFEALGGKAKLSTLKNMYQETTMEVMSMEVPSKIWIVFGEAMRQEVEVQGQKIVTFIGKDSGWTVNPLMGSTTAQPLPAGAVKGYASVLTPGGEFASFKENGYKVNVEGKEDINGKPAYKIKLTKDSADSFFFIDLATSYLVRSIIKADAMGQQVEIVTTFSDYKKTPEGYVFPYTSVISNPMMGEIKATVTKLDINKAVDVKELQQSETK